MRSLALPLCALFLVSTSAQAETRYLKKGEKGKAIAAESLGIGGGIVETVVGAGTSEAGIGVPVVVKGGLDSVVNIKNLYRTLRYNESPKAATALSYMGDKMGAGPAMMTALDVTDVVMSFLALDYKTIVIGKGALAMVRNPILNVKLLEASTYLRGLGAVSTGALKWLSEDEPSLLTERSLANASRRADSAAIEQSAQDGNRKK